MAKPNGFKTSELAVAVLVFQDSKSETGRIQRNTLYLHYVCYYRNGLSERMYIKYERVHVA